MRSSDDLPEPLSPSTPIFAPSKRPIEAPSSSDRPSGSVWAMGSNTNGQLGLGAADDDAHPTAAQLAALGSGVVQVAAGDHFSAALTAGGEVYAVYLWGGNSYGQLGDGTGRTGRESAGTDRVEPTHITSLGTDTVQLALGYRHALALKQGGGDRGDAADELCGIKTSSAAKHECELGMVCK